MIGRGCVLGLLFFAVMAIIITTIKATSNNRLTAILASLVCRG